MATKRLSKSGLVAAIATKMNISKSDAKDFLDSLQGLAESELQSVGEFVIPGIVKVAKRHRKSRMGRNPATGASIHIPAKDVVRAKIAKSLKDLL